MPITKRVFSKDKFYYRVGYTPAWAEKCDGLTEDEMKELGFITDDSWMIEVPVDTPNVICDVTFMVNEIDRLKESLELANKEIQKLSKTNEELSVELQDSIVELNDLDNEYNELDEEHNELRKEYIELSDEYSEIEHDYEVLSKEHLKLVSNTKSAKLLSEKLTEKLDYL